MNIGTGQYQSRGRGRPTSRGGGRPSSKNTEWDREYKEWDELQATGSKSYRDQQSWEEESWKDYKDHKDNHRSQREYHRNPDMTHQREGYYTVEYEERKRARSPSSRRHERHDRRDHSPRYEHEKGKGRGRRNYSPEDRGSRRYPSHDR